MDGHIITDNAYRYFQHNELKNSNSKLFIFYGRVNKQSTDNVGILGLKTSNLLRWQYKIRKKNYLLFTRYKCFYYFTVYLNFKPNTVLENYYQLLKNPEDHY